MTSFQLTVPPAAEPVSLAEAKLQARIDGDADDALVAGLISAARQWAEASTGRAFIHQTWQMWLDRWPDDGGFVSLPRPPLVSVSSIRVFDDSDSAVVWPVEAYFVDSARQPGRVVVRTGASLPIPGRAANGICIEYVAGYGTDSDDVPEMLRTAIRQLVTHWYEHRGEAWTGAGVGTGPVPLVIQALLDPFRVRQIS